MQYEVAKNVHETYNANEMSTWPVVVNDLNERSLRENLLLEAHDLVARVFEKRYKNELELELRFPKALRKHRHIFTIMGNVNYNFCCLRPPIYKQMLEEFRRMPPIVRSNIIEFRQIAAAKVQSQPASMQ